MISQETRRSVAEMSQCLFSLISWDIYDLNYHSSATKSWDIGSWLGISTNPNILVAENPNLVVLAVLGYRELAN